MLYRTLHTFLYTEDVVSGYPTSLLHGVPNKSAAWGTTEVCCVGVPHKSAMWGYHASLLCGVLQAGLGSCRLPGSTVQDSELLVLCDAELRSCLPDG